ncbi:S-layer homology domain-containing protein [Fusibacter bizertensis]
MKTNIERLKKVNIMVLTLVMILVSSVSTTTYAASPSETTLTEAASFGTQMGTLDGDVAGRYDRSAGKGNLSTKSIPSSTTLIDRFKLNNDSMSYQNAFITAYRAAFEIAYNTGYRTVSIDEYTSLFENGYDHGAQAGTVQGQLSAMIDFVQGKSDDWSKAYSNYLLGGSLSARYLLDRETIAYQNYFASGFREAFMNNYIDTFQSKNLETEIRNKNARQVSMTENTLYFDEEYVHFTLGTIQSEMRTPLSLYFPAATVYQPTYFAAFKTQNTFNYKNSKYTPASSKYTISVMNSSGSIVLRKPITLAFEYYGSERVGIYQWIGNRWVYQYTSLADNSISIQIPAGTYSGGEYAIFIDEDYKTVEDIIFNWAYKEIYTLMRRNVISDDKMFSPNAKITRAQLAEYMYNTLSPTDSLKISVPMINDASSLGTSKKAIEYMIGKRYLTLDSNGNFNPTLPVSYSEVETMLSKMFLRNVSWKEISNKMLMEKYARSSGALNTSESITKAEVAYMITVFFR